MTFSAMRQVCFTVREARRERRKQKAVLVEYRFGSANLFVFVLFCWLENIWVSGLRFIGYIYIEFYFVLKVLFAFNILLYCVVDFDHFSVNCANRHFYNYTNTVCVLLRNHKNVVKKTKRSKTLRELRSR